MKKIKKFKPLILLLATGIVTFGLAGCGANTVNSKGFQGHATEKNEKFNPTSMKTVYSNVLKGLVTDKTITQDQSDKVIEAVTKNMPTDGQKPVANNSNGEQKPDSNNVGDNQKSMSDAQPNEGKPADNASPNGGQSDEGKQRDGKHGPGGKELNELVTNKVITQTQADKISQKVHEAMQTSQGHSSNQ